MYKNSKTLPCFRSSPRQCNLSKNTKERTIQLLVSLTTPIGNQSHTPFTSLEIWILPKLHIRRATKSKMQIRNLLPHNNSSICSRRGNSKSKRLQVTFQKQIMSEIQETVSEIENESLPRDSRMNVGTLLSRRNTYLT